MYARLPLALPRRIMLCAFSMAVFTFLGCAATSPRWSPQPPAPRVEATSAELAKAFSGLVEAHNLEREKAELPPLEVSETLNLVAKENADDMAATGRMSHQGSDGSSPFDRMKSWGYQFQSAGENIAYGQQSLEDLMSSWMKSPGHKANILGKFTEMGAAYAIDADGTPYWCVTFGTPISR